MGATGRVFDYMLRGVLPRGIRAAWVTGCEVAEDAVDCDGTGGEGVPDGIGLRQPAGRSQLCPRIRIPSDWSARRILNSLLIRSLYNPLTRLSTSAITFEDRTHPMVSHGV